MAIFIVSESSNLERRSGLSDMRSTECWFPRFMLARRTLASQRAEHPIPQLRSDVASDGEAAGGDESTRTPIQFAQTTTTNAFCRGDYYCTKDPFNYPKTRFSTREPASRSSTRSISRPSFNQSMARCSTSRLKESVPSKRSTSCTQKIPPSNSSLSSLLHSFTQS